MGEMTLSDLSKKMRDIDFMMLMTKAEGGEIAGRPMSNNGDVEYDGDSWFFSTEDTSAVEHIARDPKVTLSAQGSKGLMGKPPLFLSIEGQAELVRDKAMAAKHWKKDLEHWYPQGLETPGLLMIKVRASLIHYWDGMDEGEVRV